MFRIAEAKGAVHGNTTPEAQNLVKTKQRRIGDDSIRGTVASKYQSTT
jgi:hypothetical protein